MNRVFTYCLFLLLTASATGCTGDTDSAAEESQARAVASPDTLLKDVDARAIQEVISSYKGDKAVLVNVWATWCLPCVEEFPEIVEIQREYPEELQVIFISADFPDARERALKFLKDQNVNWTTYFKDSKDEPFINALSEEWSGALPFTKVIDTNGNEVAHWENKASFDKFNTHVQQAIKP